MTSGFGASTLDQIIITWTCSSCGAELEDPAVRVLGSVPYVDLQGFQARGARLFDRYSNDEEIEPPSCPDCSRAASVTLVDHHAHHQGLGADLVVRGREPGASELLVWTPSAGFLPASLDQGQVREFELCALVRSAALFGMGIQEEDFDSLVARVEPAIASFNGDELLLDFLPLLLNEGRAGLCGDICARHIEAHPRDPRGHAALGELTLVAINQRAIPMDRLPEARAQIERALSLDPDHAPAHGTLGAIRRMEGDLVGARASYERVIDLVPEDAEARYNLAVMLLETEPETSLEHFRAGAELAPADPDYPLGEARALARLGEEDEARAALARARDRDPDHPRIDEVASSLGL